MQFEILLKSLFRRGTWIGRIGRISRVRRRRRCLLCVFRCRSVGRWWHHWVCTEFRLFRIKSRLHLVRSGRRNWLLLVWTWRWLIHHMHWRSSSRRNRHSKWLSCLLSSFKTIGKSTAASNYGHTEQECEETPHSSIAAVVGGLVPVKKKGKSVKKV